MSESLQETQFNNTLSMYEVDSPMGRGAGSFVYKVKNRKTKQFAALKVIEKNCQGAEKIKQRTQNEIEVHSKLEHENIVALHAHFEDNDNYYLLLELCEGGELYNLVKKKGRLSEPEVRNYGLQLAKGLKYLHDNRVLHRDLKLSNLLLTEQNVLKICDFGLSVQLTDLRSERDTICGTPNYISPEVIRQESYGTKADTWAYGCILFAMATGNPPFEGSSVKETLTRVQNRDFVLPKDISPVFQDLLKKLICWDTKARFDINDVLTHDFFLDKPHPHPGRLVIENNTSISFADADVFSDDVDTNVDQQCDFSKSTNCYTSGFAKIQRQPQHQKSNSAASSPLLKKPPLGNKKLQASQFSYSTSTASSENKENMGDSYSSLSSLNKQDKQDYNKNRCIMNEIDTDSSVFSGYQPLKVIDPNVPNHLNACKKRGISSSNTSDNSSMGGDDDSNSKAPMNRNTIKPFNTNGLKPNKFKIKVGAIEVFTNGWICLDLANNKRRITISPDGFKIKIEKGASFKVEKTYSLSTLPTKYVKFYTYISQVCETMRTRVPRVKVEDNEGTFSLLQNKPFPHFEGKFVTGEKVSHTVSSEIMKIQLKDGRVYEINVLEDASDLDEYLNSIVKRSLDKMNLCIQKEGITN